MQSPKTGMNSAEVCPIDGWAFAYSTYKSTESAVGRRGKVRKPTSSATSMGPGMTSNLCNEIMSNHGHFLYRNPTHLCGAYGESCQYFSATRYACMLACLNPVIVLRNTRPDLASVGSVRSEGAIVRDSKVIIKIGNPELRVDHHAPSDSGVWTTTDSSSDWHLYN